MTAVLLLLVSSLLSIANATNTACLSLPPEVLEEFQNNPTGDLGFPCLSGYGFHAVDACFDRFDPPPGAPPSAGDDFDRQWLWQGRPVCI